MVENVRNVAPFINQTFTLTTSFWVYYLGGSLHRGVDYATYDGCPIYSILNGTVLYRGDWDSTAGNYIIVWDNNKSSSTYGYAYRYLHMKQPSSLNVGDTVRIGDLVGYQGNTGYSFGSHLHLEMQDISKHGYWWKRSDNRDDYLDPTAYCGTSNSEYSTWIYNGNPNSSPINNNNNNNDNNNTNTTNQKNNKRRRAGFMWVEYLNNIRKR